MQLEKKVYFIDHDEKFSPEINRVFLEFRRFFLTAFRFIDRSVESEHCKFSDFFIYYDIRISNSRQGCFGGIPRFFALFFAVLCPSSRFTAK